MKLKLSLLLLLALVLAGAWVVFAQDAIKNNILLTPHEMKWTIHNKDVASMVTKDRLSQEINPFCFKKHPLCRALLSIDGITGADIYKYEVLLTKAELYSWQDIQPKVAVAINKYFDTPAQQPPAQERRPHKNRPYEGIGPISDVTCKRLGDYIFALEKRGREELESRGELIIQKIYIDALRERNAALEKRVAELEKRRP